MRERRAKLRACDCHGRVAGRESRVRRRHACRQRCSASWCIEIYIEKGKRENDTSKSPKTGFTYRDEGC
jgi:hypothetical protein